MKFDFIIGNPPYQEETESDSTRMPPVYHHFMEQSYAIADKVCLITPARFLFNAGYTPKQWNEKMLCDPHFKVEMYEADSSRVFPNTDIKGGIAITYRDARKKFGKIEIFTTYPELNGILRKVLPVADEWLPEIMSSALNFRVSDLFKTEHPELIGRLRTNAFTALAPVFFEECPSDGHEYVRLFGLIGTKRALRWIRRDYLNETKPVLDKWNVFVPESNGSGAIGEVLSTPLVGEPLVGYTQTFLSIGTFGAKEEAEACLKYVKSKFARCMLGVLKITQHNPPEKWKYVPLQDFTSASDIDWAASIPEIDRQLYAKYGLDEQEIRFIESHVKEMS